MRFPTVPDKAVPHLAVNEDTGNFIYAVSQLPPGKSYMAEGQSCSWSDFMSIWSRATDKEGRYEQVSVQQMIEAAQDRAFGEELADMFAYSSDPGYDGGDSELLTAADIRKVHRFPCKSRFRADTAQLGVDCQMTSLEEYMQEADWSVVFGA